MAFQIKTQVLIEALLDMILKVWSITSVPNFHKENRRILHSIFNKKRQQNDVDNAKVFKKGLRLVEPH